MGWFARAGSAGCVLIAVCLATALRVGVARAQEKAQADSPDGISFKFTPSWYRSSDANNAYDLNLRGNLGEHTAWVGYYHDSSGYGQTRAVVRRRMASEQRLTVDVSHKSGLTPDENFVRGNALTLTYDYRNCFARIARDQYVNFSNTHQTRFSLGMRF